MVRILYGRQPADLIGGPFAVYVFDDGRVTASTTGCQSVDAAREKGPATTTSGTATTPK